MREIKVRHSDGNTSKVRCFDHPGSRVRLLWIPALGTPARQYDQLGEALRSDGLSCAMMDWRGLGSSSVRVERGVDFGYDQLLSDIDDHIAALRKRNPKQLLLLGGHSLGGQIAALSSLNHDCNGLVLCGTGVPYWKHFGALAGSALLLATSGITMLGKLFGRFPGRALRFAGNEAPGVMADWVQCVRTGVYRVNGQPVDGQLSQLRTAVLAVRMEHDRLIPKASYDALLNKLPRARASRHCLENTDFQRSKADHFGWMREPRPMAKVITAWWQEQQRLQNVG
jgi:predicted alpha/beta hydrolase